jgi:hypothetical protein
MGEVIRINETEIALKEILRKEIHGKFNIIHSAGKDKQKHVLDCCHSF